MIQIQKATSEHLDEIVSLWLKLMNLHKDFDEDFFANTDNSGVEYKMILNANFKDKSSTLFIATCDTKIIGYVTANISWFKYSSYNANSYCTLGDIMIDENYRHLGIGKSFIEEIKKWAKSESVHKIVLDVFSKNTKALSFFKKQGFDDNFNNLVLEF
ncbi:MULTISPECIES: GNAT family N-acetyltransferase [unclassified Flavobacterium]|jgi:ribosomal protein S18 acetylase RimI-like enzyme|uniref:GNAT family N-acetyltransferase n=1 Tax=unclassified Flavobacterium TaxID=196869 RepID=UPI0025BB061F|nr:MULTISPECIES: GNAT family N-acetyltransferase [unclassified Flavobacterium]